MIKINDTVDEEYYEIYEGFNRKPIIMIEYLDDSGVWQKLEDVLNMSFSLQSDDDRMGVYTLLPPSGSFSLSLLNTSNQFTPDAGGAYDGIIKIGRKVRFRQSYELE
jgi:hypothetical protein